MRRGLRETIVVYGLQLMVNRMAIRLKPDTFWGKNRISVALPDQSAC
jgi:hypothetical protein